MPFLVSLFFGFAPMFLFAAIFYSLDHYEKEPIPLLVGVFVWGAAVAAGGAYILNTLFGLTVFALTGSPELSDFSTASISAPLVEEGLKGLAVLLVFLFFRHEFDSLLDGIVYAGIAALGFAATENALYIWRGYESDGWTGLVALVIIRVVLVGWQHPVYTAFTGMGLAIARGNRSWLVKIVAGFAGLGLAMFTHSFHNTLASFTSLENLTCFIGLALDWMGVFFLFAVILLAGWQERRDILLYLREEVELGIISPAQHRTAASAWLRGFARLSALFAGNFSATHRFYQVMGELAHKKRQFIRLGAESGTGAAVLRYRAELQNLAPRVQS